MKYYLIDNLSGCKLTTKNNEKVRNRSYNAIVITKPMSLMSCPKQQN